MNKRLLQPIIFSIVLLGGWYLTKVLWEKARPGDFVVTTAQAGTESSATDETPAVVVTTNEAGSMPGGEVGLAAGAATGPTTGVAVVGPGTMPGMGGVGTVQAATTTSAAVANGGGGLTVVGGPATRVTLGTSKEHVVSIDVDGTGAGLSATAMKEIADTVDDEAPNPFKPYTFQTPYMTSRKELAMALATRTLTIDDGKPIDLWNVSWRLDAHSDSMAQFSVDILRDGKPLLTVTKIYTLGAKDESKKGSEYEMGLVYRIDAQQAAKVSLQLNGPNAALAENYRDVPSIVAGFDTGSSVEMKYEAFSGLGPKNAEYNILDLDKGVGLGWVGATSAYWDAIVLRDARQSTMTLSEVKALALSSTEAIGGAISMVTTEQTVTPGTAAKLSFVVFMGPKERSILNGTYLSSYPRQYNQTLVLSSTFCGICTWPWLIDGLVSLLKIFHLVLHDWGLAIIALVLIVRVILHPITKRSQVSMSRMTKLGPEMERLKKKYADDPEELRRVQAEFIKEQGIAPFLGCLPMFLQMPIWLALYSGLQSTFELRHAHFLQFGTLHLTWLKDLSQPDRLLGINTPINFLFIHIDGLNILPILMAIVFYFQFKMQPKAPSMTKEQEQQQKMLQFMSPILIPLMCYPAPAGLNLYILTSTTIGIIESKRIRDHIKEKEAAEKAGKVFVETAATRGKKLAAQKEEEPKKKTGIAGWVEGLQEKVEEYRTEADKQKKKKK